MHIFHNKVHESKLNEIAFSEFFPLRNNFIMPKLDIQLSVNILDIFLKINVVHILFTKIPIAI